MSEPIDLYEILSDENGEVKSKLMDRDNGCNVMNGLIIIKKYMGNKDIVCGAEHDVIYSVGVEDLIEAGITKDDAIELRAQNWMIEYDGLACFV